MLERKSNLIRPDLRQERLAVAADDGGVSRGELFAFARRHAWVIFGCMLASLLLSWLNVASQEPTFTARAQILIDPRTPEVLNTEGRSVETSLDTAEVESQTTLLRSELIATMVIDALDLTNDPEFQGQKPSRLDMLVNSVAELLLKSGLVDPSQVYNWRDRNLRRAEAEPQDKATPIVGAAETPIDPRRLALAIFQSKLGVSRVSVSYVIEIAFSSRDSARAAQIANATADAYLREQVLSKIAAIQQGNAWLEERLNELRRKLNMATQAAQTFRAHHDFGIPEAAPADVATITSLDPAGGEVKEEATLEELEATADTYRKLYGSVLEAYTASVQYQSFPYSAIRVITPAAEPFEKSRPNTKISLAFGGLVGLLLGLGAAFARESLDGSIRSPRQIRADLGVDCIAEIPRMSGWSRERRLLAAGELDPGSRFVAALTRLKTAVRVNARGGGPVAVGLTSALRGEGKSVTALGLGLACVQAGYRTLVVDCDPHPASLSAAYPHLSAGQEGETGKPLRHDGWFDLMPAGQAGMTERGWKSLEQPYDVVIVDLPPIERAIDTLPGAPGLDFVMILAAWGETPLEAVGEAVRISGALGAPLLGVVLTRTPRSRARPGRSADKKAADHPIR